MKAVILIRTRIEVSMSVLKCMAPCLRVVWLVVAAAFSLATWQPVSGFQDRPQPETGNQATTVVAEIDRMVGQVWDEYELKPSDPATEGEWCRRLFLDLLGRTPRVDELRAFVEDDSESKRAALVEQLLHSDAYTNDLSRNWTTIWTNLLIGRTGGSADNSMISRAGMQKYLRDSFARNRPWDQMVHELVTATGTTTPGTEGFNGAVNFLIDKVNDENAAQATAACSQLFLGLQVQCTQCHNHPFNDWKQQKYWEFNAFFRQTRAFRGRTDADPAQLADQDYRGESGNQDEADLFYELRNGLVKVAYPVFVDGTSIGKSGYVNVTNRRAELSRLMLASPWMAEVMANRMWGHFLGYGFTKPVDDLGPHNPPTNPELLQFLAQQFRSSGYDVRQLMTWIVLSKPYSLSSCRNDSNEVDDPLAGNPPRFSVFYLRQMRAEELYESLVSSTQAGASEGSYEQQEERKNRWLQQFSQAFGNDEGTETTTFNGTISQILMLFNGELSRETTSIDPGAFLTRLTSEPGMDDLDRVEYLFELGLARKPDRDERQVAQALLSARNGNSLEMLRDVWWIILNSNEFIFNH
jgi:Protein of unknown function (DUF1549)/Protein of unknown function (DUF1553)